MSGARKSLLTLASLGLSAVLLATLFLALNIRVGDISKAVSATNSLVLAGVLVLTLANQLISVLRWRLLSLRLKPDKLPPPWIAGARATMRGALVGQLLPPQLAIPAARWASFKSPDSINATFYEQLLDFLLLVAFAIAGVLLISLRPGSLMAIVILSVAAVSSVGAMPVLLRSADKAVQYLSRSKTGGKFSSKVRETLRRTARLPRNLLLIVAALSLLRLAVLCTRTIIVVATIAVLAAPSIIVLGYPLVGLAMGVPFLPSGMGVADWSLVGIIVIAGGTASAAATASLSLRVLTFGAIAVLVAIFEIVSTFMGRVGGRSEALAR